MGKQDEREKCRCPDCGALHLQRRYPDGPPPRPSTAARDAAFFEQYEQGGVTLAKIAEEAGISAGLVSNVIRREGIRRFGPGWMSRRVAARQAVIDAYLAKDQPSIPDVAKKLKRSPSTVREVIDNYRRQTEGVCKCGHHHFDHHRETRPIYRPVGGVLYRAKAANPVACSRCRCDSFSGPPPIRPDLEPYYSVPEDSVAG